MTISALCRELETAGLETPRAALYPTFPDGNRPATLRLLAMGLRPIPGTGPRPEAGRVALAPFAAVHHYRKIATALKQSARRIRTATGLDKRSIRIFSNSRLPERSLAAALGFGWVGRNGLLMNREFGSSFLLGGLLIETPSAELIRLFPEADGLPRICSLTPPADPHAPCGSCRACAAACPTGAIAAEGGILRERCLQHLSTLDGPLPPFAERVWETRLYGCQRCQEACPVDRGRVRRLPPLPAEREYPDPASLLAAFAADPPRALREILPDTALEASWIPRDAILRNLLTAAGRSGRPELIPYVAPFLEAGRDYVRDAAREALRRLRQG